MSYGEDKGMSLFSWACSACLSFWKLSLKSTGRNCSMLQLHPGILNLRQRCLMLLLRVLLFYFFFLSSNTESRLMSVVMCEVRTAEK